MLTVQNIKDAFERYKRDIDDVTDPVFIEWVQFTTRFIYDKVKGVEAERFLQSELYTVTDDPFTSALPADFQDMNQTACGLYLMDDTTATDTKLGITGYGSTDTGYYLDGSNIVFTGAEDDIYTMRYIAVPPVLTALTDYITVDGTNATAEIVEDRHLDYFVKAVDVLYEQWVNDPANESLADFRFVRALGELLGSYNRRPQISIIRNQSEDY